MDLKCKNIWCKRRRGGKEEGRKLYDRSYRQLQKIFVNR